MLRIASPPVTFEPCIPTAADRPPSGPGWVHEIKHDGFRIIGRRDRAGARLLTGNGHDFTDRYPAVTAALGRLPCRSCVIDGEVAIVDDEGRAVFDRLQNGPRIKPEAILFAFDLLELNGTDLCSMPLLTRKSRLLTLLRGAPAGLIFNEHLEGDADVIFRQASDLGCEGIVSKRAVSPYQSGRSKHWIKTKAPAAIEAQKVRSENWNQR